MAFAAPPRAVALDANGIAQPVCVGDCDGNGRVTVNELVLGVQIALGEQPLSRCPSFDPSGSGKVELNELIRALNNSLSGCPGGSPSPTPTQVPGGTATVTPSLTAVVPSATPSLTPAPTNTAGATATPADTASFRFCGIASMTYCRIRNTEIRKNRLQRMTGKVFSNS
jgi:hypothetical protein